MEEFIAYVFGVLFIYEILIFLLEFFYSILNVLNAINILK